MELKIRNLGLPIKCSFSKINIPYSSEANKKEKGKGRGCGKYLKKNKTRNLP